MNNFAEFIRSQIRVALGRRLTVAAIFLAAIAIMLFAFAFLLMAAQEWLTQWYQSPIKSDLTVGAGLALIAIIAAICGLVMQKKPVREVRNPVGLALALPVAVRLAPRLLNRKAIGVASMVLGAVLIGREIGGRR